MVEFALNQKFALQPDSLEAERAIYEAVRHADTAVLVLLLDQGIMSKKALCRHGSALLYESMSAPSMGVAKNAIDILLAHGVDTDARDKYGQTVLLKAIESHKHEIVPFLLERGAEPVPKSNDTDCYPLVVAATYNLFKVTKDLLETNEKRNIPLEHWEPQWDLVEQTAKSEAWEKRTKRLLVHYHWRKKYPPPGKPSSSNSEAKGLEGEQSSGNEKSNKSARVQKAARASGKARAAALKK